MDNAFFGWFYDRCFTIFLMDHFEQWYQLSQTKFVVGRKTTKEFLAQLSDVVNVELVDVANVWLEKWQKHLLATLQFNVAHHSDQIGINHDKYDFQLYRVLRDKKSEKYYHDPNFTNWAEGELWIYLEITTCIFQTNGQVLGKDLCIYRGISQGDIEARNLNFKWCLNLFQDDM